MATQSIPLLQWTSADQWTGILAAAGSNKSFVGGIFSGSSLIVFRQFCFLCNFGLLAGMVEMVERTGEAIPTEVTHRWLRSGFSHIEHLYDPNHHHNFHHHCHYRGYHHDHNFEQRERRAPVPRRQSSGAAPSSAAAGLENIYDQPTLITRVKMEILADQKIQGQMKRDTHWG